MIDEMERFVRELSAREKSELTKEKYVRDVGRFLSFAGREGLSRETAVGWKRALVEADYSPKSINSMLAALNAYASFCGREDCRVRYLKTQRQTYCPEERELSRAEYFRLVEAAKSRPRLQLMLQTIGGTGIRVSELRYFTLEAARAGEVRVSAKGKERTILIPGRLKLRLLRYCRENGISEGVIFRTRSGKPLDRSNIWAEMKGLCAAADVRQGKVFPHNLRKLFARSFYDLDKDIAKLADVLGHSSIDTTRIYIVSSGNEHRRALDWMDLVK